MGERLIYGFGPGRTEGAGLPATLLGGKGAGLAQMSGLGIPVPPGFTITTAVCRHFHAHGGSYPEGLADEFRRELATLEAATGRRFGDPANPLLLSVRSGAAVSMPGMMDTILNLGLNDEIVAAQVAAGADERFLRDCHRRLVTMYGDVVLGVPHEELERILSAARSEAGAATDADLPAAALAEVVRQDKALLERYGTPFPDDPREQLWGAVGAVFESWNIRRAREYRRLHGIADDLGTAVNVQAMVFGNRGPDCATGVAFTRDPSTGERAIYGEYLVNAQGEDVVAGTRTPRSIHADGSEHAGLAADFPAAWEELQRVCAVLERERREMQDVEFTIEDGRLYMLQTRSGKRTGPAAVRIAVDMVAEGLIDDETALRRVEGSQLAQLLAPVFDPDEKRTAIQHGRLLARGLAAGPGAASGRIALTAERAAEMAAGGAVLLVREETSPEDIVGMHASAGILTSRGGMTSHAAVVARGMGKPCIVGAGELVVDERAGELRVGDRVFREGDELSMDGSTGEVLAGALAPHPAEVLEAAISGAESAHPTVLAYRRLLGWADERRRMGVRANADTPHDARVARALGAAGIGLCRTEHMFFDEDRLPWVRRLILAEGEDERRHALDHLLPVQRADFEGIFEAMDGLPVTVRLLDPPLHEFLPRDERAVAELAGQMGVAVARIHGMIEALAEFNPMLGHRGCRLGLTHPTIYAMQVEAVARAVCALARRGLDPRPEIMMPLVGTETEMRLLREAALAVIDRVRREEDVDLPIPLGTMIEVPRAALVADRIARHADFFSFGTNDLTQMTYGYSRDDANRFLPQYIDGGVLAGDPFESLDAEGVGQLVELACQRGRSARGDLKLGVCGEHGGDPASIRFFERCGLDYVSCSPYRVPVARLAAARAALGD